MGKNVTYVPKAPIPIQEPTTVLTAGGIWAGWYWIIGAIVLGLITTGIILAFQDDDGPGGKKPDSGMVVKDYERPKHPPRRTTTIGRPKDKPPMGPPTHNVPDHSGSGMMFLTSLGILYWFRKRNS